MCKEAPVVTERCAAPAVYGDSPLVCVVQPPFRVCLLYLLELQEFVVELSLGHHRSLLCSFSACRRSPQSSVAKHTTSLTPMYPTLYSVVSWREYSPYSFAFHTLRQPVCRRSLHSRSPFAQQLQCCTPPFPLNGGCAFYVRASVLRCLVRCLLAVCCVLPKVRDGCLAWYVISLCPPSGTHVVCFRVGLLPVVAIDALLVVFVVVIIVRARITPCWHSHPLSPSHHLPAAIVSRNHSLTRCLSPPRTVLSSTCSHTSPSTCSCIRCGDLCQ